MNCIIRPDILALHSYHVPDASGLIKLDAMENPYQLPSELQNQLAQRLAAVALNRYPVPSYTNLKSTIRSALGVPQQHGLVLGNGSDELIALLSIACAKPGAKVLAPLPGFVMYAMSAQFAGLEFIGVPLRADFTLDQAAMLAAIAQHQPAITYLAYPNNPTGNLFDENQMLEIIAACAEFGVVVVDEAYQPFAHASFMPRLAQFENLIVMRTVSKLGLAGIRLGYMAGAPALMEQFDKVRPPYNVNVLTEAAAQFALEHAAVLDVQAATLCAAREQLRADLLDLPGVEVMPSAANFLLIRLQRRSADAVFADLLTHKVLVKNVSKMHQLLAGCLRITVGSAEENATLLAALDAALKT